MSDESADGDAAAATKPDGEAAAEDIQNPEDDTEEESEPEETSVAYDELNEEGLVAEIGPHDEDLAAAVADRFEAFEERKRELESDLDDARERIDELESALKRSRADFENYKKRAKRKQEEIRSRATEDLVQRLTSVRDNLLRALDQDEDADIRPGVESTLSEFEQVLQDENVEFIEPEPGDEVDPGRHEVLMRVDSDQPEGTIVEVYAPGYEMAGKVIQEAQVTVSSEE